MRGELPKQQADKFRGMSVQKYGQGRMESDTFSKTLEMSLKVERKVSRKRIDQLEI